MATPNEKLAESLDVLKALQQGGRRVFRSDDLSRVHRERLVANGFLQEVMKGWLISSSPSARAGDSTPWYASFWEFCARYCNDRFGEEWHLSPEQSLLLHGERTVIPDQVVVNSPKGTNNAIELLFGTSLYDLKVPAMPATADLVVRDGLRLFSPAAALVRVVGILFPAKSGRDAGGAGQPWRCVGPAAALAEWRPLRESGLSGGSVPADRPARFGG